MFTWGTCLPLSRIDVLGPIRLVDDVRVLATGDELWLAGSEVDVELERKRAAMPAARHFAILPDGQLVRPGERVPCGHLPRGEWLRLRDWLCVAPATSMFAAVTPQRVMLKLVRGGAMESPNVLVISGAQWLTYAESAPAVRLRQWSFAVDVNDREIRVVIRGTPLPPISGQAFVAQCGIAAPVGFHWQPPVDAEVLRDTFALNPNDLIVLHPDGTQERIAADKFVQATRSAVRLSLRSLSIVGGV